jgi:hypothetical protein
MQGFEFNGIQSMGCKLNEGFAYSRVLMARFNWW